MLTVFVEHPIIFIGYSLQDENILKILQAIIECFSPDKIDKLKNRLIFVEWEEEQKDMDVSTYAINFGNGKSIDMTKIKLSDYSQLYKILLQVKSKYPTKLLRQIKNDIYKLTLTTDPNEKLVALNLSQNSTDEEFQYVFGIGALEVGKTGYNIVTAERIYRDIIFDEACFFNEFIVEYTIPSLMSNCSINIPIYKYVSQYNEELPEKYNKFKDLKFDHFLNRKLKKIRRYHPYNSIQEILSEPYLNLNKKLDYIAALPEQEISPIDLHTFLVNLLEEEPEILHSGTNKSVVKKLIRIYDWIQYKE